MRQNVVHFVSPDKDNVPVVAAVQAILFDHVIAYEIDIEFALDVGGVCKRRTLAAISNQFNGRKRSRPNRPRQLDAHAATVKNLVRNRNRIASMNRRISPPQPNVQRNPNPPLENNSRDVAPDGPRRIFQHCHSPIRGKHQNLPATSWDVPNISNVASTFRPNCLIVNAGLARRVHQRQRVGCATSATHNDAIALTSQQTLPRQRQRSNPRTTSSSTEHDHPSRRGAGQQRRPPADALNVFKRIVHVSPREVNTQCASRYRSENADVPERRRLERCDRKGEPILRIPYFQCRTCSDFLLVSS
jgi:hypothetical protein